MARDPIDDEIDEKLARLSQTLQIERSRLLRVSEVAQELGVHTDTVRTMIKSGSVRAIRFGAHGWHRIPREELDRLLAGE